jgi:peptidoglycan/LPS O-acetylase OafA/YrhL
MLTPDFGEFRTPSRASMASIRLTQLPERNLDLLRAIAVLCVFANHSIGIFTRRIGFLTPEDLGRDGVLFFFVHTSLVLMSSMERHGARSNWIWTFYKRRLFRIYPLAIVIVVAIVTFHIPPFARGTFEVPIRSVLIGNLTLTQNLLGVGSLTGPLWSLPIELQMYVFLPFLWIVAVRWGVTGIIGAIGVAAVAGLVASTNLHWLDLLRYAPCFLAGVFIYAVKRAGVRTRIPSVLFPLLLLGAIGGYAAIVHFPSPLWGEWLLCFCVAFLLAFTREMRESRLTRVAKQVAKYSYGIYLVHNPMLAIGHTMMVDYPIWQRVAVTVTGLVLFPIILYQAVERPFILLGSKVRPLQLASIVPAP